MKRRAALRALACALVARPTAVLAQGARRVHRIGYLSLRPSPGPNDDAFVRALGDLGHVVGRNLTIEYRWAGNRMELLKPLAEELVTTPAVDAAMRATPRIAIVMTIVSDPVRAGLVTSLARPGGNATGAVAVDHRRCAEARGLAIPQSLLARADEVMR